MSVVEALMNVREESSHVLGWLSIGCWIVVYSPQIMENYTLKSGEGLSVLFVIIWLLGDLCNLIGSALAGLLPTVIILAVYYTICDLILFFQIYYYRIVHHSLRDNTDSTPGPSRSSDSSETSPLITSTDDSKRQPVAPRASLRRGLIKYALLALFVVGVGFAALIYDEVQARRPSRGPHAPPSSGKDVYEWRSQVFGWVSAVMYLGSRIPQIIKNTQTRCEGLSLALFLFAIVGNLTYVLSILVVSMEWNHIRTNASWLAGSGLTIFLDVLVMGQFVYYRRQDKLAEEIMKGTDSEEL